MLTKDDKRLFKEQTTIIRFISSGTPLEKTLEFIVTSLEKSYPAIQMFSSIMLFDPIRKKLGRLVSSSLPQPYVEAVQSIDIGLYEGSCGTAAFLKKPVIVPDVGNSPLWEKHRDAVNSVGFRASWSVPILSSENELLGTFAIYYMQVQLPNEEMLNRLELYTNLAAIAIESDRTIKNSREQETIHSFEVENRLKVIAEQNEDMLYQLKKALARGEFEIYYQPYFALEKEGCGVEALIRWNHPNSGVLPPAVFLDVAEQTGFILEMEKWVIKRSIQDVKSLHGKGFENLRLSVNISAQQLENPEFPAMIADLLQCESFIPEYLTLEVTERFLIKKNTVEVLNRLKESGVKISIDDFGTAYSSLQYLKDMQVDELKIDRSFISNMEESFNNQKIVEMIILLGHQLNMKVVAEGVETESQLQLLKDMKCDIVQGFLFSKPIPLVKLEEKYAYKLGYAVLSK